MIDLKSTNEWQWIDESCGLVYPWFTKPFLDVLKTWDLSDKNVLEFGSGASTVWFDKKCRQLVSVETNAKWYYKICEATHANNKDFRSIYMLKEINEGDQSKIEEYVNCSDDLPITFDIVVVDGILRNECLKKGIELLSKNGGIIIADNWQQDYVWISPQAEEMMKPYEKYLFVQPDHTEHEGRPWTTAYFIIPKQ